MLLDFLLGGPIGFSGNGYIAGNAPAIVTVAGVPAPRPVRVLERKSLRLCGFATSASDGTFSISGLDTGRQFLVIALDNQGQFNAVIRDNITPAPMP
jgi:hypothetical protein